MSEGNSLDRPDESRLDQTKSVAQKKTDSSPSKFAKHALEIPDRLWKYPQVWQTVVFTQDGVTFRKFARSEKGAFSIPRPGCMGGELDEELQKSAADFARALRIQAKHRENDRFTATIVFGSLAVLGAVSIRLRDEMGTQTLEAYLGAALLFLVAIAVGLWRANKAAMLEEYATGWQEVADDS